jgi:hypothetical protein
MNEYDLEAIRAEVGRSGCEEEGIERTDHGGIAGVVLLVRKSR